MSLCSKRLAACLILRRILEYATYQPTNKVTTKTWKPLLGLLSVNHEWRKQALPLVYNHVFIRDDNTYSQHIHQQPGNWDTNIDLLRAVDATIMTKSVIIALSDHINLDHFLKNSSVLFGAAQYKWTNVRSLYFRRSLDTQEGREFIMYSDPNRLSMQMADFGHLITSFMPQITSVQLLATRIQLNQIDTNSLTVGTSNTLCDMLCQAYSSQLKSLKCSFYPTNTFLAQFNSLCVLEVSLQNHYNYCFASIDAHTLKVLRILEAPVHFSLAKFFNAAYGSTSAMEKLVFDNLLSLHIEFSKDAIESDGQNSRSDWNPSSLCKISYPRLKQLQLAELPVTYANNMFAENYPEHLDSLNISCNMVSIHNLNNMMKQVASIKDITLSIKDINAHEKDQFYSITNWLLGPHMHCQSASLTVTGIKFDLDDARISWTNVSKLLVVSLIKYETLTQLLRKCKSLQSLATGLDLTTHVAGSWDHMQDNVLPPINTSLEALRIVGMSQEVDKNKVCEAFKGLLFQLPALSKLNLSFGIQLHISDMVEKYKDVYPHLPNIAVSQGRIILLNRSNGRMRALFTRTGAPSLSIQSRTYNQ